MSKTASAREVAEGMMLARRERASDWAPSFLERMSDSME